MYYHNEPQVELVSEKRTAQRTTHNKAPEYSFNWIIGSPKIEKITSPSGAVCNNGDNHTSRISKQAFLSKFLELKHRFPQLGSNVTQPLYENEKLLAVDYQEAKEACTDAFLSLGLGDWRFVMKPDVIDRFHFNT